MKLYRLWRLNRDRQIIYKYIKIHNGFPGTYYDYGMTAKDILDKILEEQKQIKISNGL